MKKYCKECGSLLNSDQECPNCNIEVYKKDNEIEKENIKKELHEKDLKIQELEKKLESEKEKTNKYKKEKQKRKDNQNIKINYTTILKILKTIWDIFRYIFGSIFILGGLSTLSIIDILLGISFFPITYKLLNKKIDDEAMLKKLAIILPFVLMFLSITFFSTNSAEKDDIINQTNKTTTMASIEEVESINAPSNNQQIEDTTSYIEKYTIMYDEEGQFGKRQDYEGYQDVFYYFPEGTYKVTRVSGTEKYCFLWLFYKNSYQTEWGTSYNSKDKYTFLGNNSTNNVVVTSDVMIYNSNKCNYELIKEA